jgi:hypothetical protein
MSFFGWDIVMTALKDFHTRSLTENRDKLKNEDKLTKELKCIWLGRQSLFQTFDEVLEKVDVQEIKELLSSRRTSQL